MSRFAVLLDACALVPVALADTLLRLAEEGLYRPLWSDEILAEMVRALDRVHPEHTEGTRRRVNAMRACFADAMVEGWEHLVGSMEMPDPNDRHVVAAAIVGHADAIVTSNVADFPQDLIGRFGMEVQTPDVFLLNQLHLDPSSVMRTLRQQAEATRNPELTVLQVIGHLENVMPRSSRMRSVNGCENSLRPPPDQGAKNRWHRAVSGTEGCHWFGVTVVSGPVVSV